MAQMMNVKNIKIERASIDDVEKILEIQKSAFLGQAHIYDNYELPPLMQGLKSIEDEFNEKTFLKVAINDKIIASVRFQTNDGHVTIDRLVVEPEYQNQGIGTALMKELELIVYDAKSFQLFTGNKSSRNIHLYEKIGYKTINKETTGQGIELLHMVKKP